MYRVTVTDTLRPVTPEQAILTENGISVEYGKCRNESELIEFTQNSDGIINVYARLTAKVINALKKCQVIVRRGIGFDNIDVKAATAKSIPVANVLGYCIDEVADHTMALLLCIARRIIGARGHTKNGYWDIGQFKPLPALKDCTLGLIGFGDIARAVTARARCFGLSIQTSDPFISGELASRHGAKLVGLEELLSSSDFISIHVPLTDDTRRMLSRREFLMVKPSAVLINTARGPIVDEEALREALNAKRIAFVALDVMAREPPGLDNPLLRMENVVITPHIAWYSEHSAELLGEMTARQILSVFKGYFPEYLVNPEVIELRPDLKQIDLSS